MKRGALIFLGAWAIFLLVFRDVAFGGFTFIAPDIHPFYYPVWHLVSEMRMDGVLPLWNPYMKFGAPLLANVQACVFYPMTFFFYGGDFLAGFNHYLLFHLAMASFFTRLFLRARGASEAASLISGIAFGMSGYVLSMIHLSITLCSVAYFPLVLLWFGRGLEERGFFWKAAAASALLLQYLAGDPTICLATVLVCFLWTLERTLSGSLSQKKPALRPLAACGAMFACFAGLSAFQSLLFAELVLHSTRMTQGAAAAGQWSAEPSQLWGIALPYWMDMSNQLMKNGTARHWLENAYAGLSVLLLASLSLFAAKKSSVEKKLLWLALLGIVLSLGPRFFVYGFLYDFVPPFRAIRFPVRFFFLVNFSLACLAGLGFDRLRAGLRSRGALAAALVPVFLVLLFLPKPVFQAVLFILSKAYSIRAEEAFPFASSVCFGLRHIFFYGLGTLALFLVFSRVKMPAVWKGALMLVWVFFDLSAANVHEPAVLRELVRAVPGNAAKVLEDPGLFRVMASEETVNASYGGGRTPLVEDVRRRGEMFFPNLPLLQRLHFFWGYDSLFLDGIFEVSSEIAKTDPGNNPWLSLANVKYLASPSESLPGDFELIRKDPAANLFLNKSAAPRAFLVPVASARLGENGIDFGPSPDLGKVDIPEYSPNRVRMTARTEGSSWLFFSDTYYPGWKAVVDGVPVPILRAHRAFRAVLLAGGQHEIVWSYDPPLFKWGMGISLITLAAMVFLVQKSRNNIVN